MARKPKAPVPDAASTAPRDDSAAVGASPRPAPKTPPAKAKTNGRTRKNTGQHAVGLNGNGGGVGTILTQEEKKALRLQVRAAKKADKATAEKKAQTKRTRSQGRKATKEDGTKGVPPWEPSETDQAQIMALAGFGMTLEETGVILGVTDETLIKNRELIETMRIKGLAIAKSRVRQSAYQEAVGGSLGHIRFVEERVFGWVPNQKVEHSAPGGGPIQIERRLATDDEIISKLLTLVDRSASIIAAGEAETATAAETAEAEGRAVELDIAQHGPTHETVDVAPDVPAS